MPGANASIFTSLFTFWAYDHPVEAMQQFTVSVLNDPIRSLMTFLSMMMMTMSMTRLRLDEGELGAAHKAAGWRRMFAFWARFKPIHLFVQNIFYRKNCQTKILQTALRRGLVLAQSLQHLRSPFFPFLFVCPLEYLHAEYALQTEAPHSLSLSRGDEDVWNPRSTKFWAYLPPLVPFVSFARSSL